MKATFIQNSVRLLAAFGLTAAVALTGAPRASSEGPKDELASLEKSIVFLQTTWSGSIQVPPSADAAGQGYWTDKLKLSATCTGWYVSATAQVVTAGHCVDPAEGRKDLLDGYLKSQNASNMEATAYANWRVEGEAGGSPPDRSVQAIQPNGVDDATITSATTVEVVDFKATEAGDIALLHVPNMSKQTPGLVVAQNAPQVGDSVTSIGFPGDIQDITDQSQIARASFKTGSVSSNQVTKSGVVQIEVSTDLAGGMSGGPTVNKDGQVVGVNSRGLTGEAGFNFITNTPDLRSFLLSHNVPLVEPPSGLDKDAAGGALFIIGGIVLTAAAATAVLVLLLRRRRTPQFAAGTPASGYPPPGAPPSPAQPSVPGQMPAQTGPGSETPQPAAPTIAEFAAPSDVSTAPPPGGSFEQPSAAASPSEPRASGIFCPSCGAPHRPDDHFCPGCGKPVG